MDLKPEDITKNVKRMMRYGFAPSEIDDTLHLPEGTAHDIVITEWRKGRSASMNDDEL